MAQAVECHPLNSVELGSILVQSVWDLWWFKWHWDRNSPSSWFQTFTVFWLLYSFFWFSGIWILWADVSEHSVCSIFIGGLSLCCLWRWNRQSVLKCWHIKFRCEGITQNKEYNILQVFHFSAVSFHCVILALAVLLNNTG